MIDTDRLTLRGWRRDDVGPFIRHLNKPAVMRWLGGVRSKAFLESVVLERFIPWQERFGHTFWVVERKEDGAFLGFCGLKRADGNGSSVAGEIEIGWRFREDSWGRGYAKEAATASLDFAFERLTTPRVVALTVEGNSNSWGLMRRLGMTRRQDLDYVDSDWPQAMNPVIVYEMRRENWRG